MISLVPIQVSEEAADPEMREVAADAYASLLRVKGHDSSADLAGMRTDEAVSMRHLAPPDVHNLHRRLCLLGRLHSCTGAPEAGGKVAPMVVACAQGTSGHHAGEELCNCEFSLAYGEGSHAACEGSLQKRCTMIGTTLVPVQAY